MPTLYKYKPSSDKNGYYIRAYAGGSHPITLQVTQIAEVLFQHTGYTPNQAIPTKLIWSMHEIDLLYTETSFDSSGIQSGSVEHIVQSLGLGNELSESEVKEIASYIEDYEGPQNNALKKLKNKLEPANSKTRKYTSQNNNKNIESSGGDTHESLLDSHDLESLYDDFREVKESIDKEFLLHSLQIFDSYPHTDIEQAQATQNLSIQYPVSSPSGQSNYHVIHRSTDDSRYPPHDYVIQFSDKQENIKAIVSDGEVEKFISEHDTKYNIKLQSLKRDLDWILPIEAYKNNSSTSEETTAAMSVGEVVFFNDSGGYGFISTDNLDEDVFFHMEEVGGSDLEEGQEVEFDFEQVKKGPRVTKLSRL